MDRFLFKILVDFPTKEELKQIVAITVGGQAESLTEILSGQDLLEAREIIREIPISESVEDYALQLVVNTHPELPGAPEMVKKYVSCGASPRAAQAIIQTAKGRAFLAGRFNVSFEDINQVALPALRHRLLLNYEAVAEGIGPDEIIQGLLTNS